MGGELAISAPDLDVVVVGGGAAGLFTALRASENPDLRVAIFEKNSQGLCNTQISSGSLAAGGTRLQKAAGIDDSPDLHASDILAVNKDPSSEPLVRQLCGVAPMYVEWLMDDLSYPMELGVDMPRGGQSRPRLHTDTGRQGGSFLIQRLREAAESRPNLAFVDRTPVVRLLTEGERVVGVEIRESSGLTQVSSHAVVLASDGFAADPTAVAAHIPEAADAIYCGVSSSTGDALRWATDLNLALSKMGSFLGHGLVVPGHATRLNPAIPFRGGLLVNAQGHRFVDEHAHGYSSLSAIVREQPGARAALIWSAEIHAALMNSELMRESERSGAFAMYSDVESLAQGTRVDASGLSETLKDFLAFDEVTRSRGQLEFPLYGAPITRGILVSQGGIDISLSGEALNSDGDPVEGLYAAGGAAVGISGTGCEGYSSGNGLLAACGMGWIVGNTLARIGS